ncbi:MAG: MFS transporter [Chloroflexota bacterium]
MAVLLANSALMSAGFYLLIPLLSVHLTQNAGFSGAAAGAVLAVRQLTQQGLMPFGGALADRVGYRPIIALGMLVRALGFFGFALGDDLSVVLLSAVVAALGGALFEATGKASLAALAPDAERPRLFSLSALAGGIGTTGGPLLGTLLLPLGFAWVGIAAGVFFVLAGILAALLLPPLAPPGGGAPSLGQTLRAVSRDGAFLRFTALLTGYWFLHNQIYISVPLRAVQVTGSAGIVGVLYATAAAAGLALQYPLVRLASRIMTPASTVAAGVALMGAGLGMMGLAGGPSSVAVLVLSVVVFAAGRALAEPTKDVVVAGMAPAGSLAGYFGVAFLALAAGGSAGNYAGGWLFDVATATGSAVLPWLVFAVCGLLIAGALFAFSRTWTRPVARAAG